MTSCRRAKLGSGAGALGKITLPSWNSWPDVAGAGARFSGFGIVIPWLAPMWIGGVSVFYLRYAAAWHTTSNSGFTSRQTNQTAENPWQKWLNEDVVYTITDEEKAALNA